MTMSLIRYRTRPEAAAENRRLITHVFDALRAQPLPDVRYLVLELPDGHFLHLVDRGPGATGPGIPELPAFKAFRASLEERCLEPPQPASATLVGNHGWLPR